MVFWLFLGFLYLHFRSDSRLVLGYFYTLFSAISRACFWAIFSRGYFLSRVLRVEHYLVGEEYSGGEPDI